MIFTKKDTLQIDPEILIAEKTGNHELNTMLLIVPTNRLIRSLRKEFLFQSPGQYTSTMNFDTLATFSEKIFRETHDVPGKEISEAAAMVLLRQSFKKTDLTYFSSFKNAIPEGTLRRIMNVISQYKRHGITPSHLMKEAEELNGSEKLKALEIANVYEAYIQKFEELALFELGDIYRNILSLNADEFNKRFRNLYPQVKLVVVKGFDEFTSPEIEIINNLTMIEGNSFYLDLDYDIANQMVFGHLGKTFGTLKSKEFYYYQTDRKSNKEFRQIIKQDLFNGKQNIKKDYTGRISIIEAQDKEKEIDVIAKQIKELLISKEAEASEICVAFNMISSFSRLIRDRFTLYGIPFNLTDRYALNCSPAVISIFNLLEILENDYYYKNIIRAFGSDYLNNFGINTNNLQKCAAELRIISGYKNWIDTLQDNLETDKIKYERGIKDIQKINSLLMPLTKKLTPAQFKSALHELIKKLDLVSKVLKLEPGAVEESIKAITLFIETADEIISLIVMEKGKDEKLSARHYISNIRTAVNSSRYNIKERPGSGVLITSINEIRGLEFDYLFIGGLTDGDFPLRYSPEIFYSGTYFVKEESHSAEERYNFYQALCSWRKKLWLSHALTDGKKELTRSSFLNDLTSLFEHSVLQEKDFTLSAYSKEELLKYFGSGYPELGNQIPPVIVDDLESDKLRYEDPLSWYNGILGDNYKELPDTEFSITQLESYAKCPFKYYCERILKLKPVEEPSEEVEASEMGSLLHNILYEFYTTIRKENILLPAASVEEFRYSEELIFKIAEQKIKDAGFTSPGTFFERERILGIDGNKRNSILYQFLLYEKEGDPEYVPSFFETEFGGAKKVDANGVFLKGKIDRIDINHNKKTFKIIDYKLSQKKIMKDDLLTGISLQIPLYMYAAKEIIRLETHQEYTAAGGDIYSLKFKSGDFGRTPVKFKTGIPPEEDAEYLIKVALDHVQELRAGIMKGLFNLSTHPDRAGKACKYCNFKSICRVSDFD